VASLPLSFVDALCPICSGKDRVDCAQKLGDHVSDYEWNYAEIGIGRRIYAGLTIFSFCADLLFCLEEPRGVSVAKAYLWVSPTLVIPLHIILALAGVRVDLARVVVWRLTYSVVW